ncbi:hypothetical protein GOP47_0017467 [Adiantum capillus-veneris]|uniref:Uncharacterized protein n=1 Tax=Adiantum capillus-veneris TaxID=13818 RepID=A0A9D4Z9Q5_ADICA|nr:hypothetical protein GOP47_0017467 [Adiantum capillus-veneris]
MQDVATQPAAREEGAASPLQGEVAPLDVAVPLDSWLNIHHDLPAPRHARSSREEACILTVLGPHAVEVQ